MRTLQVFRALGPVDARSASRDSLLRWIVLFAPFFGLLARFATPAIAEWLDARLGFDLGPYYPLIMSFMGLIAAGFVGTVIAFLVLDQRDDQTLSALLVTPMSLGDYLRYRLAVPTVLSVILSPLVFVLAGLTPLTVSQVLVSSLAAAPLAALYVVFIGSVAANKVQGFAIAKAAGVFIFPAIVAYFVAPPWQDLFGLLPSYWPLKVFWDFHDGAIASAWIHAGVGVAYQSLLLYWLTRHLAKVMRR